MQGTIPIRLLGALAMLLALFSVPIPAQADPEDVAAAARGVVRVVVLGQDGDQLFPISHGTGFVVDDRTIVTNAHVVEEVLQLPGLTLGIVPPEAGAALPGSLVSYSPRNDLAIIRADRPLRLPPLAIASVPPADGAMVSAVGYPMNVDRAQGLSIQDVLRAQPPVKSRGYLSGQRPTREFDTILHTAPIARGNSGGPLLDNCGRVVGINSFGTESNGTDSEFYFAVSARELLPYLRANGVSARVNGLPCRSMAELDAEEQAVATRKARAAMDVARRQEAETLKRRAEARREAERDVIEARDDGMAVAALMLALATIAGLVGWQAREAGNERRVRPAAIICAVALCAMILAWVLRPSLDSIDRRALALLRNDAGDAPAIVPKAPAPAAPQAEEVAMTCTLDPGRSRVTSAGTDDVPVTWRIDGCVNGRTQYGLADGGWSRIFVPQDEPLVSVARYDPEAREYKVERYSLDHAAIEAVRAVRAGFDTPACGGGAAAARQLGNAQKALSNLLPARPNERLVYRCTGQGG